MHEYEIFIEDINPCGGEQYSKKTLIEPGSLCKRKWKIPDPGNYK